MLIQNTASNMAQAPQPVRLASDGAPAPVVVSPSNVAAQASAPVELPQAAVKQAAEQKLSAEQLKSTVDDINRALRQANRSLQFSVDEDSKQPLVKLVDTDTGDVIRQFPSKEAIAISRAIAEFQQGALLKKEA